MRYLVMPNRTKSNYIQYREYLKANDLPYVRGQWPMMKRAYTQETGLDADRSTLAEIMVAHEISMSRALMDETEPEVMTSDAETQTPSARTSFVGTQTPSARTSFAGTQTPSVLSSSAGTQTPSVLTSSTGTQTAPFAVRNGSLEDEIREHLPERSRTEALLAALLQQNGNISPEELVDDAGIPFSKNKLLQLAAVSPLWGKLTANQKREFLANEGVLESGRGYVSKTVLNRAPTRGVTTLVDQTGKKIVL